MLQLVVIGLLGCGPEVSFTDEERAALGALASLDAPPPDPTNAAADDPDAAWLGQALFFDTALSSTGEVSCATCHDPAQGWGDGKPVAETLARGPRHTPSLWNNAWNRWFFWDGRCDSAWCQAIGPIENPGEMGGSRVDAVRHVHGDPALAAAFEAAFGSLPDLSDTARFPAGARPIPEAPEHPAQVAWAAMADDDRAAIDAAFVDLGKAIAAYERKIQSRDSAFDAFARALVAEDPGAEDLLPVEAQRGAALFVGDGLCHVCHGGPNLSFGEFNNLGLSPQPWLPPDDVGRHRGAQAVVASPFNGVGPFSDDPEHAASKLAFLEANDEMLGQFKTPSLRSVATHPPYFHGGQAEDLEAVVRHYQTPVGTPAHGHREETLLLISLFEQDIPDLVAFLETLDGAPLDASLLGPPPGR